jgi:hypothetical protein
MRETVSAGELTAIIGDNQSEDGQRAGHHGLQSLTSIHAPGESLFVPGLAGINLAHLLDGREMASDDVFSEPRHRPMELERLDSQSVMLHQDATPTLGVQSLMTFSLRLPHYIDIDLRLVLRRETLAHDYLLAFYASYINAPESSGMHFIGRPRYEPVGEGWLELNPPSQSVGATVCSIAVDPELPHAMARESAIFSRSDLAWTRPFFFGRHGQMVFALMLEPGHDLRFTHSPGAGGAGSPAWSFQWVLHRPRVDDEHRLRARAIYKPWESDRDIVREYEHWDPLVS